MDNTKHQGDNMGTRKIEYVIQTKTSQGWEDVTVEYTRKEGNSRLVEYNENMPEYAHRTIMRWVPEDV